MLRGVALLLEEAGLDARAGWAVAEGADAFAMNVSVPLAKLMDDAIVALWQNGEPIRPEHGYPLRLVLPGYEGVLNVKWLRRLQLTAEPLMARNETAKYTELQPDGKARQFTFVMEAKSLITSPSPGLALQGPDVYEIRGLAWSGRGRIRKGGLGRRRRPWAEAALDGKSAVLKSRATDETGYVQPAREALVRQRGLNGYFHYNAIVAWAVDAEGSVTHVYA